MVNVYRNAVKVCFQNSSVRLAATASAIVIGVVALRLRERPDYLEPVYFKTALSLSHHGDIYHLRESYWGKGFREGLTLDELSHLTVTGHAPVPTPLGRGFYAWPFLLAGQAIIQSSLLGPFPDLWVWQNLSGLIPLALALILLWRTMRKRADAVAVSVSLGAVYFGTFLFLALHTQPGASEALAFLFWSAIFSLCLEIWESGRCPLSRSVLLGFCCGSAIFIRLPSIVWLVPPAVCWWRVLSRRGAGVGRSILSGVVFALMVVASAAPQLLVWKCWWGKYLVNAYGHLVRETPRDVISIWLKYPRFFTTTLIAPLGMAGLVLGFRRWSFFPVAGLAMFVLLIGNGFGQVSFIESQSVSSRHFLVLVPIYFFGLVELLLAFPRRRRLLIVLVVSVAAVSYLQATGYAGRIRLPEGPTAVDYFRAHLNRIWYLFRPVPDRMGIVIAALLLIPAGVILLATVAWGQLPGARRRQGQRLAEIVVPVLISGFFIISTARACAKSRGAVAGRWAEGFYRDRWLTAGFSWGYFASDAQMRMVSYLELGNFPAAEKLFNLIMNIDPRGEGEAGLAPQRMQAYRDQHEIPGHLWENFSASYRDPTLVREISGVEWSDQSALVDGDFRTVARAERFIPAGNNLVIRLDRVGKPLSDVVVVLENSRVAQRIQVDVSSDGVSWGKPFRVERWFDTLWVWDLHQRPWNYLRLSGFDGPEEAAAREIFAFFSLRHTQ